MKKITSLLLVVWVLFSACKDEDNVPRTIFTFQSSLQDPNVELWIVLRDDDTGELIDSRKINKGSAEIFESSMNISKGTMAVSVIEVTTGGHEGVSVYSGIPVGTVWQYSGPREYTQTSDRGNLLGKYIVKITGLPSLFDVTVSDKFGSVMPSKPGLNGGQIQLDPSVYQNGKDHLISIDPGDGHPKYLILNDVAPSNVVTPPTIDFSSFKEYDKLVKFTVPTGTTISARAIGYEQPPFNSLSYIVTRSVGGAFFNRTEATLGFLNTFSNYTIMVGSHGFEYTLVGPPPASIDWVDRLDYVPSGTTIENFQIATTKSFIYCDAYFVQPGTGFTAHFYSPASNSKIFNPITPELATRFGIDASKLAYTTVQIEVKGRSYSDFLKTVFDRDYDINTDVYEQVNVGYSVNE